MQHPSRSHEQALRTELSRGGPPRLDPAPLVRRVRPRSGMHVQPHAPVFHRAGPAGLPHSPAERPDDARLDVGGDDGPRRHHPRHVLRHQHRRGHLRHAPGDGARARGRRAATDAHLRQRRRRRHPRRRLLSRGRVGDHALPAEHRAGRADPRRPVRCHGRALPRRHAARPHRAVLRDDRVPHVPGHPDPGARTLSRRARRIRARPPARSPSRRTCPPASSSSTGPAPAASRSRPSRPATSRARGWPPRRTTAAATP